MRDALKYIAWLMVFTALFVVGLIFSHAAFGETNKVQRDRVLAYVVDVGECLDFNGRKAIVIPMRADIDVDGEKIACPVYAGIYQEQNNKAFFQIHIEIPVDPDENGNKQVVTHFVRDTNSDMLPDIFQVSTVVYTKKGIVLKNAGWSKLSDSAQSKKSRELWGLVMSTLCKVADKHFGIKEA